MRQLWEVLLFRKMVSPVVLQVLFWAGIGGCVYGAYVLIRLDHWAWWMPLTFGPLLVRVVFERAIIAFLTYDRLTELVERSRAAR